ncbi:MAG: extracellular solute-binding protein [Bacteroides sp.]|nr:extracellular solute-binding protein [Prevotella sp.]MCM1407937.1 extracellular solute-binding protein [Treponema brennaborense]MCM1469679.1 extracellular solute-binding protein [Bacteroides sp.]
MNFMQTYAGRLLFALLIYACISAAAFGSGTSEQQTETAVKTAPLELLICNAGNSILDARIAKASEQADIAVFPVYASFTQAQDAAFYLDSPSYGLMCNADIFKTLMLAAPATFKELECVCTVLHKKSIYPFAAAISGESAAVFFIHALLSAQENPLPMQYERALYLIDFYHANANKNSLSAAQTDSLELFLSAKASMMFCSAAEYRNISKQTAFETIFIPFPFFNAPAASALCTTPMSFVFSAPPDIIIEEKIHFFFGALARRPEIFSDKISDILMQYLSKKISKNRCIEKLTSEM